jgi:hypothetical protein
VPRTERVVKEFAPRWCEPAKLRVPKSLAGITEQGKIGEEKMDKQFQRKGEKSNTQIGKEFEEKTLEYFRKKGIELKKQYIIEIGLDSKKEHRFDLGNNDTIVECKAMRWTETENVPSAKIGSWNEAMYYFSLAPKEYKKIFFVERHYSQKYSKTLLEHYIDNYYHLIPNDVVLYDYDSDSNRCKIYTSEDIKNRKKSSIKKYVPIKHSNFLHSKDETIINDKEFIYDNKKYIARSYKQGNNSHVYYKILLKNDENRCINSMDIARKYLRSFGIQIKSDMNTHRTVKKLMDVLEQNIKP